MKNNEFGVTAQISWVYCKDLERSTAFYRDALGLECLRDVGNARIFATTGQAAIGVCEAFADRVVEPRGGLISLVTGDVDACYCRLRERDVDVEQPPHRLERFAIRTFFLRDPDGYLIEFQQFLED